MRRELVALRRLGAAFLVVAVSGCHAYRPATVAELPADTPVRVSLTAGGAAMVDSVAGPGHDRPFPALYLGRDGDRLAFGVPLVERDPGTATRAVHTRVLLPPHHVVAVQARALSVRRTALAALAGVGLPIAGWLLLR